MATYVETYRGFEIWVSAPDEFVPGIVYYIASGPTTIPGYWSKLSAARNHIDAQYSTTKEYVETYRGVDIYWQAYRQGLFNLYSATVGIQTKYFPNWNITGCRTWIDRQLEEEKPGLETTFQASPTSGPAPLAVTFTIGISGGYTPYTWSLDPGDGSTPYTGSRSAAGSFTRTHTYTTVGTFTATLTITDALGATAFSRSVTYAGVLPIPDIVLLISGLAPLITVASVIAASELQRIHIFG